MKKLFALPLLFLIAFGIALAYSQSGPELLAAANFSTALSDGTFKNTGSCSPSGNAVVSQSQFKSCAGNNGSCFSGYAATQVPTFAAMQACANAGATAAPSSSPTPVPTATPVHTTGISVTDGCITNTSNWPDAGGAVTESFQSNSTITGSTCGSTGNQLDNGTARQALNGGNAIAAGTSVTIAADLYGATQTVTVGSTVNGCQPASATANGTAAVELVNSAGTVESKKSLSANAAWSQQSFAFTIATSGVYYVLIASTKQSTTATGTTYVAAHNACEATTATATATGYVTGVSASSS